MATETDYGLRVRQLFAERLGPNLGPDAVANPDEYQADLDRIRDHVDATFSQIERLPTRVAILSDGLVASFGAMARTWCSHGTLATAYQNAHAFGKALRKLLASMQRERQQQ